MYCRCERTSQPLTYHSQCIDKAIRASKPKGVLLDGFPRTLENLEAFTRWRGGSCDLAIVLECPEEVMLERLLKRGKDSGRWDDQEVDVIKHRFKNYNDLSVPVVKRLVECGKRVSVVDSSKQTQAVTNQIAEILKEAGFTSVEGK